MLVDCGHLIFTHSPRNRNPLVVVVGGGSNGATAVVVVVVADRSVR